METVILPDAGIDGAWRDAARGLLARDVAPDAVLWQSGEAPADLFAGAPAAVAPAPDALRVPKSFVELADLVVWHRDPERFARLYALLWRLRGAPRLMQDRADPAVARLQEMARAVRRDMHKMKAFVRFREIGDPDARRRSFAAWFEPGHLTVEPTAPFFVRRFSDMDWRIATPEKTAIFLNGDLSFAAGQPKPPLPEDATEALWTTYFRNIFNPARVKTDAMRAEMPKKYWKNMPETRAIPQMLAEAQARVWQMAEAQPTLAPAHAAPARRQVASHASVWDGDTDSLTAEIRQCTRCPLYAMATQAVPGEGDWNSDLMIVGEQPGDREDLEGRPFVGPAGAMLDDGLKVAGIDRARVFVTNAVKHFRFEPRGKRRIHQRPNAGHVEACRWWLDIEEKRLDPQLILAMGATAVQALTGSGKDILKRRSKVEQSRLGHAVLVTVHPSYLLRLRDPAQKADETARFHDDLRTAAKHIA